MTQRPVRVFQVSAESYTFTDLVHTSKNVLKSTNESVLHHIQYTSESEKNQNIEKTTYKFVQMKFLAMHITNQFFLYIFTVGNLQNIFMEHDLY